MDYWYGGNTSGKRPRKPLSPAICNSFVDEAELAMDNWIKANGHRASGSIAEFKWDESKSYGGGEMDTLEAEVLASTDVILTGELNE